MCKVYKYFANRFIIMITIIKMALNGKCMLHVLKLVQKLFIHWFSEWLYLFIWKNAEHWEYDSRVHLGWKTVICQYKPLSLEKLYEFPIWLWLGKQVSSFKWRSLKSTLFRHSLVWFAKWYGALSCIKKHIFLKEYGFLNHSVIYALKKKNTINTIWN